VIFKYFRMESISIKHLHGIAKVLGSVICVSGVLVFAFVKGPPVNFMNWYPSNDHKQVQDSSKTCCSREEWIKGSLIMISANTLWSLWLVLQVNSCSSNLSILLSWSPFGLLLLCFLLLFFYVLHSVYFSSLL